MGPRKGAIRPRETPTGGTEPLPGELGTPRSLTCTPSDPLRVMAPRNHFSVLNPIMTFDQPTMRAINKEKEKVYIRLCANKLSLSIKKTKQSISQPSKKSIDNDCIVQN